LNGEHVHVRCHLADSVSAGMRLRGFHARSIRVVPRFSQPLFVAHHRSDTNVALLRDDTDHVVHDLGARA
jgi:hypothetical protein